MSVEKLELRFWATQRRTCPSVSLFLFVTFWYCADWTACLCNLQAEIKAWTMVTLVTTCSKFSGRNLTTKLDNADQSTLANCRRH